jgi:hypothetical protein
MTFAPYGWQASAESALGGTVSDSTAVPERKIGIGWVDVALICVFLLGLYTNYTIMISAKVPFPSAPSGIAGVILLLRRHNQISERGLVGLLGVLFLYVLSILLAPNLSFLPRRLNGLIQLSYSIVIGYALFLTVVQARRRQIAGLFLGIAIFILIGCLLEDYTGLRAISDHVRQVIYRSGVYENDLRDMLLYNRVRPKFFASEPASVTFCFSLFTFVWFVVSRWRWKLFLYVALVGIGIFAMPGPTLMLMLVMVLPYMLFLASRRNGRLHFLNLFKVATVAVVFLGAFIVLGQSLFSARLKEISHGNDPSFFYRVQGPAIAGLDIMVNYPIAGAGLTGEPFFEQRVVNQYARSPAFSTAWRVVSPATELIINYFWLHWVYLGLFFGVAMIFAITSWFYALGVPSVAFCWMVWAILGQASGAYVGPTCWAVLFLCAAAAVLHQRSEATESRRRSTSAPIDLQSRLDVGRPRTADDPHLLTHGQ